MMHSAHLTIHTFIGAGLHNALIPPSPAPLPPPGCPHISMSTLLGLTLGAKYSKTVIGPFGFQFIGEENDSGKPVAHISIPPANLLVPVTILMGGSNVMFTASTVKLDIDGAGKKMAACCFPIVPLSLNQGCNEPCNFPGDLVIAPNSVYVGLTFGDFVAGVVGILVDSAVNYVAGKIGDGVADAASKALANAFAKQTAKEIAQLVGKETAEVVTKQEIKEMAEAILENIEERAIVQVTKEFIAETVESISGGIIGDGLKPTPAGGAAAPAGGSSANSMDGMTQPGPGNDVHDAQ